MKGGHMKYHKIEALLKLKGLNLASYADYLKVSRQQITNKKKADSFKADDLIQLAELTNTKMCFVDEKGDILISFNSDDLSK